MLDVHAVRTLFNSSATAVKECCSQEETRQTPHPHALVITWLPCLLRECVINIHSETRLFSVGGLHSPTSFLFWVRNDLVLSDSVSFLPTPSTCAVWCNVLSLPMFYFKRQIRLSPKVFLFFFFFFFKKSKRTRGTAKALTFWLDNSERVPGSRVPSLCSTGLSVHTQGLICLFTIFFTFLNPHLSDQRTEKMPWNKFLWKSDCHGHLEVLDKSTQ